MTRRFGILLVALIAIAQAGTLHRGTFALIATGPVYVPAGTTRVIFEGAVANTQAIDPLNLNDQVSIGFSENLALDTNYFFANVPGVLEHKPGELSKYSGGVFAVDLDPGTPAGMYIGSVQILGGAGIDASEPIEGAARGFTIVVMP